MLTKKYQNRINELKKEFDLLKIDKSSLLKILNEIEISEAVYNSNAIENSTLTIDETEQILLDMEISRNISLREIFEARNLAQVTEYIYKNRKRLDLNTDIMLLLHKMLISNINDKIAGRFRKLNEYVRVGRHLAPAPSEIDKLMKKLLNDFLKSDQSILSRVSVFHLFFETIHPFIDGNGRIGRVLINLTLLKEGFPPVIIRNSEKHYYYDTFKLYNNKEEEIAINNLEKILFLQLSESFNKRITYLKGEKIITITEFSKNSEESKHSLLNKAKRQTIPAFREKGVWKIGVEN